MFFKRKEKDNRKKYALKLGLDIKIISGDNPNTVSKIASRAGIENIKSIDLSKINEEEIPKIIKIPFKANNFF